MKAYSFDKPWWMQVDIEPAPADVLDTASQADVRIATFRIAWWAFPLLFLKGIRQDCRPRPFDWPVIFLAMLGQWIVFARQRPILERRIIVVHAKAG